MTTRNDHSSYVKYDLGGIYVFFYPGWVLGVGGGGGVSQWIGTQPADAVFRPGLAHKSKFLKLIFLIS